MTAFLETSSPGRDFQFDQQFLFLKAFNSSLKTIMQLSSLLLRLKTLLIGSSFSAVLYNSRLVFTDMQVCDFTAFYFLIYVHSTMNNSLSNAQSGFIMNKGSPVHLRDKTTGKMAEYDSLFLVNDQMKIFFFISQNAQTTLDNCSQILRFLNEFEKIKTEMDNSNTRTEEATTTSTALNIRLGDLSFLGSTKDQELSLYSNLENEISKSSFHKWNEESRVFEITHSDHAYSLAMSCLALRDLNSHGKRDKFQYREMSMAIQGGLYVFAVVANNREIAVVIKPKKDSYKEAIMNYKKYLDDNFKYLFILK